MIKFVVYYDNKVVYFKVMRRVCIFILDFLCVDILRYVMNIFLWMFLWREVNFGGSIDDVLKFLIVSRKEYN